MHTISRGTRHCQDTIHTLAINCTALSCTARWHGQLYKHAETSRSFSGDLLKGRVALQAAAERRRALARRVVAAAKLVAPRVFPADAAAGWQWCMDEVVRAKLPQLADDVLMAKAASCLPGNVDEAVTVFKQFERHRGSTRTKAASNLSFLYLLEGNVGEAERYAELAKEHDEHHVQVRRSAPHLTVLPRAVVCAVHVDEQHAPWLWHRALGSQMHAIEPATSQRN